MLSGALTARELLLHGRKEEEGVITREKLEEIEADMMAMGHARGYEPAKFTENEGKRINALHNLELTMEREEGFDHLVMLARDLFGCPISAISFVDTTDQKIKAEVGIGSRGPFPRVSSICSHSFATPGDVFVVNDLTADKRFARNPLVEGEPHWAFYAGAPLVTLDGFPVGTLCIIDRKPRSDLSQRDLQRLKLLAHQVMSELHLRKALQESLMLRDRMTKLLENAFPQTIARRLLREPQIHDMVECTVCFVDLVGFTAWTSCQHDCSKVVLYLDALFGAFDLVTAETDVCKIKTIGDGYLFAAGVPEYVEDHACRAVRTATRFLQVIDGVNARFSASFRLRIGMASGKAVAGVVGTMRFAYDLWGETVNLASRVESNAQPGLVTMAPSTYDRLKGERGFEINPLPHVTHIKGIGEMQLYTVNEL